MKSRNFLVMMDIQDISFLLILAFRANFEAEIVLEFAGQIKIQKF